MAKSAQRSSSPSFEKEAKRTAKEERALQRKVDRSDQKKGMEENGGGAMQAGARVYPTSPLPDQHLRKHLLNTSGAIVGSSRVIAGHARSAVIRCAKRLAEDSDVPAVLSSLFFVP